MRRSLLCLLPVFALFFSLPAGADTLTLPLNSKSYKVFTLDNPPRVVIDSPQSSVPAISNPDSSLVAKTRAGRFDPNTVRIVLELKQHCNLAGNSLSGTKLTLELDCDGASTDASPPAPSKTKGKSKIAQAAAKPKPIEKPLIIIDPGHGGDDPGTIGGRGTQEKDVVLTFARALEDALVRSGKYRVKLTRTSDVFIPLRERVKIARTAKGSIFISLHADSAPSDDARGLSVYTLSEKASDAETEALAAHENKADIIGGMDLSGEREDVADILISLASRETRNQSAELADMLTASLAGNVRLLQNTHRFAGFAVLKAPDIPSVLIETGFLSHPAEEKLLKTQEYRKKLIGSITEGIDHYFAKQGE